MQAVEVARRYQSKGLSVIPIAADGSKAPAIPSWGPYQAQQAGDEEFKKWFKQPRGFGIVCGAISGNLEVIDFDDPSLIPLYIEKAKADGKGELINKLVQVSTPSEGLHLYYRCDSIQGNQKLASKPNPDKPGKWLTTIETRGEGGYVLAPGSPAECHPTGKRYSIRGGKIFEPQRISLDERVYLLNLARSFDQKPSGDGNKGELVEPRDELSNHVFNSRPGDDFNARADWTQLLTEAGWTLVKSQGEKTYWRKPGDKSGWHASVNYKENDKFYVFSQNCDFEAEKSYSKFEFYTLLYHNGNFSEAASALAKQGFGSQQVQRASLYVVPPTKTNDQIDGAGWIELKPLVREREPAVPYPIDALGSVLSAATKAINRSSQAPLAIIAQSVLAATAQIAQSHIDVQVDGRVSPVSLFMLTVGESGERKSEVDRCALSAHRERQRELFEKNKAELSAYEADRIAYQRSREELIKTSSKAKGKLKDGLASLGSVPEAPIEPLLLVEDPTSEGLFKLLGHGQPSVGLFSDEGGRFVNSHGMSDDHILRTSAFLCNLWDGKPISRVRASDGASMLYGKRLSMHLLVQPLVSRMIVENSVMLGQGLLSRWLMAWPESTIGTRLYREDDVNQNEDYLRYFHMLQHLLLLPLPLRDGSRNELSPRRIGLTARAKEAFILFHDSVEKEMSEGRTLATIRGFANKAPEHAIRIAATLTFIEEAGANNIGIDAMQNAIDLVAFYLNEARRISHVASVPDYLQDARELLDWLKRRKVEVISEIEIYTKGPTRIRSASKTKQVLSTLQEHGYVRPEESGITYDGKHRTAAWRIRDGI